MNLTWWVISLIAFALGIGFSVGVIRMKRARVKGGLIVAFHWIPWSFIAVIVAVSGALFGLRMLGVI